MEQSNMQALRDALHSTDEEKQVSALIALEDSGTKEFVPDVLPLLASSDNLVREQSAKFLGKYAELEDERVSQQLLPLLQDTDADVRQQAAAALGLLHYAPAIPALTARALHDPEWLVRAEAVDALERFRDPSLFQVFQEALMQDENLDVKRYAASAISNIAGPAHIFTIAQDIKALWEYPRVVVRLILALYRLDVVGSLEQLFDLFAQIDDPDVMRYVLSPLETMLTKGDIPHHIPADFPRIIAHLDEIAQRMPGFSEYRDFIQERFQQIQSGYRFPESECC